MIATEVVEGPGQNRESKESWLLGDELALSGVNAI